MIMVPIFSAKAKAGAADEKPYVRPYMKRPATLLPCKGSDKTKPNNRIPRKLQKSAGEQKWKMGLAH